MMYVCQDYDEGIKIRVQVQNMRWYRDMPMNDRHVDDTKALGTLLVSESVSISSQSFLVTLKACM